MDQGRPGRISPTFGERCEGDGLRRRRGQRGDPAELMPSDAGGGVGGCGGEGEGTAMQRIMLR